MQIIIQQIINTELHHLDPIFLKFGCCLDEGAAAPFDPRHGGNKGAREKRSLFWGGKQRHTFIQSAIYHTYGICILVFDWCQAKWNKIKQSRQSISGHHWPHHTPRRPVMRNCLLLWGSLWHTIYMKHSKCHIRQSQNIQYSTRIVRERKHPMMVVNAENIRN